MNYNEEAEQVLGEWDERDAILYGFHEESIGIMLLDDDEEEPPGAEPLPVTVYKDGKKQTRPMNEAEVEALRKVEKGGK